MLEIAGVLVRFVKIIENAFHRLGSTRFDMILIRPWAIELVDPR